MALTRVQKKMKHRTHQSRISIAAVRKRRLSLSRPMPHGSTHAVLQHKESGTSSATTVTARHDNRINIIGIKQGRGYNRLRSVADIEKMKAKLKKNTIQNFFAWQEFQISYKPGNSCPNPTYLEVT